MDSPNYTGEYHLGEESQKFCCILYNTSMALNASSLVLVAVLNNPRDLEIARLLGWYRIPLRSAPKVVAVDYLAFYQTAAFGEEGSCIQYVAQVNGHELATRQELLRDEPDHPRAREEYYKLQIGPLERLARPIRAESWRRLTFLYTTGEYLLRAETIQNLVIHTDERRMLWQALRERVENSYQAGHPSGAGELPGLDIPPTVLAALLGIQP